MLHQEFIFEPPLMSVPPYITGQHNAGWWIYYSVDFLTFALSDSSTVRRESNNGVYFAGMIRVANEEFIPEYRHADSTEFLSLAKKIELVVCTAVTINLQPVGFKCL